ncbi:hypothetical protein BX616_004213, partial [Lobosporangium transversale]
MSSTSRAFIRAATAATTTALRQQRLIPHNRRSLLTLTGAVRSIQQQQPWFKQHYRPYTTTNATGTRATVDESITPFTESILHTTRIFRNLFLVTVSTIGFGLFVWSGTHAYIEQYKCPSPSGVSSQVQQCLHGAWVREEYSPDSDIAEVYLQRALELTRKDLEDLYKKKPLTDQRHHVDNDGWFPEIEKDKALVEIHNRLARLYGRIGQDERAATIWTRLWKLAGKQFPQSTTASDSTSASFFGNLFGRSTSNRSMIAPQDGIPFAKLAATCWMRMGEYDLAEEALSWALSTVTASKQDDKDNASIDEIGLLSTLGALYVHQSKFEYALSLFVKALQMVQKHRADVGNIASDTPSTKNMWYCREAILMNSIGETLYGAATTTTATADSRSKPETKSKVEEQPIQQNKSSSWNFWASSSSSPSTSSSSSPESKATAAKAIKSLEQKQKEEEALGWVQKAVAMAKEKSGQHRDCDECAALGLNTLGLIHE